VLLDPEVQCVLQANIRDAQPVCLSCIEEHEKTNKQSIVFLILETEYRFLIKLSLQSSSNLITEVKCHLAQRRKLHRPHYPCR
jgi:hypothetical protein